MAVNVETFRVASRMAVRPDGKLELVRLSELTRNWRGPSPLPAMEPWTYVAGIYLVIGPMRGTRTLEIAFHMEHPNGDLSSLPLAKPSEWPGWYRTMIREHEREIPADVIDEAVAIGVQSVHLTAQGAMVSYPAELRFRMPGLHLVRAVIDGDRIAEQRLQIHYRHLPDDHELTP